jgi:TetR/AcrR family transcriptional regulator, transcriptional repressor for nem operon
MRLSKQQADENREHILETAIDLFHAHGFDGVGVAQLMRAAGFTHGGFYNHFPSKQALAVEACTRAFARSQLLLARALSGTRVEAWQAYVSEFLADQPNGTCTLAALAADAGRQAPTVQATFAQGIEAMLDTLSGYLAGNAGTGAPRLQALQRLSELVGAWVLARAVSHASPTLAREIRDAGRVWWPC